MKIKFKGNREDILDFFVKATGSAGSSLGILVKLEASNNSVTVSSSNTITISSGKINANVEGEGVCYFNKDDLLAIVGACKLGFTLETDKQKVKFYTDNADVVAELPLVEEYGYFSTFSNEDEEPLFTGEFLDFIKEVKEVTHVSGDSYKAITDNMYFCVDDKNNLILEAFASSRSTRLAVEKDNSYYWGELKVIGILPVISLPIFIKAIANYKTSKIDIYKTHIAVTDIATNISCSCRLTSEQSIIKSVDHANEKVWNIIDGSIYAIINTKELREALSRISPLTKSDFYITKVIISKKDSTITLSVVATGGSFQLTLPVLDGIVYDATFLLSSKYMLECLKCIHSENVKLVYTTDYKPVMLNSIDGSWQFMLARMQDRQNNQ